MDPQPHNGLMIKYRKRQDVKVTMTKSRTALKLPTVQAMLNVDDGRLIRWVEYRQIQGELRLHNVLRFIEYEGLSVEALEHVTACLQPWNARYMRDYSVIRGKR